MTACVLSVLFAANTDEPVRLHLAVMCAALCCCVILFFTSLGCCFCESIILYPSLCLVWSLLFVYLGMGFDLPCPSVLFCLFSSVHLFWPRATATTHEHESLCFH